jgi:hypothetical protein
MFFASSLCRWGVHNMLLQVSNTTGFKCEYKSRLAWFLSSDVYYCTIILQEKCEYKEYFMKATKAMILQEKISHN